MERWVCFSKKKINQNAKVPCVVNNMSILFFILSNIHGVRVYNILDPRKTARGTLICHLHKGSCSWPRMTTDRLLVFNGSERWAYLIWDHQCHNLTPVESQIAFELHHNRQKSLTRCGTLTYQVWYLCKLTFLIMYISLLRDHKWPHQNKWAGMLTCTEPYLSWICYTYILKNMRSDQATLLEVSCLQGFSQFCPKQPLPSTKRCTLRTKNNTIPGYMLT